MPNFEFGGFDQSLKGVSSITLERYEELKKQAREREEQERAEEEKQAREQTKKSRQAVGGPCPSDRRERGSRTRCLLPGSRPLLAGQGRIARRMKEASSPL